MSGAVLRYTRIAVVLHWLVAVLIIANVILGLSADHVSDANVRLVIDTHKSIGLTALGLVVLRILWRAGHAPPPLPAGYPRRERLAAHAGHALLYVIMIALPLSGWMHDSAWDGAATHPLTWFRAFEVPRIGPIMHLDAATKKSLHGLFGTFHTACSYVLYGLLALHIGAALKHQLIDREAELQRMGL